jgi:hypothetical protein
VIVVRRYRCKLCGAVMTVLPSLAQPLKHFSGGAIALALALWGLCGKSAEAVREQVNDWRTTGPGARGWRSLSRWATDASSGVLFAGLKLIAVSGDAIARAARISQALCGWAPSEQRTQALAAQAFAGAAHVG